MSTALTKGMQLSIDLTDGTRHLGVFMDIVIMAQVLPALVLECQVLGEKRTVLFPMGAISYIILPNSSILAPTISEVHGNTFSKL
jgi:hypothetical protein